LKRHEIGRSRLIESTVVEEISVWFDTRECELDFEAKSRLYAGQSDERAFLVRKMLSAELAELIVVDFGLVAGAGAFVADHSA